MGLGIGIFSLNMSMNNFAIVRAIWAKISSIGTASRKKFKNFNEITENADEVVVPATDDKLLWTDNQLNDVRRH
jgi:hypothetical protein